MRVFVASVCVLTAWLSAAVADDMVFSTVRVDFASLETIEGASAVAPGEVSGLLTLPDGPGPHPVVIMLHGCAGLLEKHERWARLFAHQGFASLRVDSFTPRGIDEICTDILKPVPRAADINGAIAYVTSQPEIDAERVILAGWSHGASVTLRALSLPGTLRDDLKARIAGGIAIYPYCIRGSVSFSAPVLILIGDADDWTPADLCETMVADVPFGSEPVELVVYEGATHSYDCMVCNGEYFGYSLVFDEAAYLDTIARVESFLAATQPPD